MGRLEGVDLARVLERLPSGVVIVDADNSVRYANRVARHLFRPSHIRAEAPLPDVPSDPQLHELARRLFASGSVDEATVKLRESTFTVSGVLDERERIGTLIIDDVSMRSRRARSGEDFVVNLSHEILAPIAAIAGAAQVLKHGAKDDPPARERFIDHIAVAAERLTSAATALLTLARAEAGLGGPRLALVRLRPLLDDVAGGKDDVSVTCPQNLAALGDADLVRQAVGIVVENARRHTDAGVGITVDETGHMVAVTIVDRGGGILPENLDRVRDRFFTTEDADAQGYGVGLSIAERAMAVLNGTMEIASDPAGTRVRLELPAARLL
jgi:signal transduction histidine kinase